MVRLGMPCFGLGCGMCLWLVCRSAALLVTFREARLSSLEAPDAVSYIASKVLECCMHCGTICHWLMWNQVVRTPFRWKQHMQQHRAKSQVAPLSCLNQ